MEWKGLVIIFLNLNTVLSYPAEIRHKEYFQISDGLTRAANRILASKALNLNLVYVSNDHEMNEFRDYFSKYIMGRVRFRVRQQHIDFAKETVSKTPRKFTTAAIRTIEEFRAICERISHGYFDFHGYFIVILIAGEIPEIQEIFDKLWYEYIYNVIVIYEDQNDHVPIVTFFPFRSSDDCSNTTPIVVNEFYNGSFKNNLKSIFPKKVQDLKGCEIKLATSNAQPPHMFLEPNETTKELQFAGRDFRFIRALSKALNFKMNFTFVSPYGCMFEGHKTEGVLKVVFEERADLAIIDCWLKIDRLVHFDATTTYFQDKLIFIFPPPPEFTSFEKLFKPLALMTWILLIIYMTVGVVSIFTVKRRSNWLQNLVIGYKVNYPYLNMAIGFLGVSQNRLPDRNFSRFLLMNFLIFSLIMRTAYQGKMFNVIQSDIRHPIPKSIKEIYQQGYKVYVFDFALDVASNSSDYSIL